MSAPPLGYLGLKIYKAMAPHWLAQDPNNGYSLAWHIHALTKRAEPTISIIRDGDDGSPGWSSVVDVNRAPDDYLDWLGQFVGVSPLDLSSLPLRLLTSNRIGNPSFEADVRGSEPSWWDIDRPNPTLSEVNDNYAASGIKSYQYRGTAGSYLVQLVTPRISLSVGETTYFKFSMRNNAVADIISIRASIYFYDSNGDWISISHREVGPLRGSSDADYAIEFPAAPIGTDYCLVGVSVNDGTDVSIDALVLSTVDVPYFDGSSYLAQWDGTVDASTSRLYEPDTDPSSLADLKRLKIREASRLRRGTLAALQATAQRRLTGTRRVLITEHFNGSPWQVRIVTFLNETPDPRGTAADLEDIRMAGYLFTYETFYGQTYEQLQAQFGPTYQNIKDAFATYDDVRTRIPS